MRAWQVIKHGEPKEVMELGEKAVPEPGLVRSVSSCALLL